MLINLLYFTNLLPPIPLILKQAEIVHSINRSGGNYVATVEAKTWWQKWQFYPSVHQTSNPNLYAYSAVFAPTNLNTTIVHDWQFYDESAKTWVSQAKIPLAISGGRDGGYRGYSQKSVMRVGKWRVNIQTARGQILGRIKFAFDVNKNASPLITEVLK